MNIIIAGVGQVGFELAKTLCIGHNVTVIDIDIEVLQQLQENLDVLPLLGDVKDPDTYEKFTNKEVDLFIAVTDLDETNLISTLIASDIIQIKRKFIRLKNDFFEKSSISEKLGINEVVFPMQHTSQTIVTLLDYPRANNIKLFEYTTSKLISVHVSQKLNPFSLEPEGFKIIGIEREKQFFVPKDNEIIQPNDLIYLFGKEEPIRELCAKLEKDVPYDKINRCVIFGGKELGITIAQALINHGIEVKLIEKNINQCKIAEEKLEGRGSIINCKYGTAKLFDEEGLSHADMMIAATEKDEYNIIKCLEAKEHGISKVIAINNEAEYYNLMHTLGIVIVRGPKMSAYNAIMERINLSGVIIEKNFCGAKAHVFMRKIFPNSKLIGKTVKVSKESQSIILLIRDEQISILTSNKILQEKDLITVFCTKQISPKLKLWIYEL